MNQHSPALTEQRCVPCEGGTPPLKAAEIEKYLEELRCTWEVERSKKIRHTFHFKDFNEAMFFVNEVAAIAEGEGHHPDIYVHYKDVVIELWTHAINGLSVNDFILASKIETCE